MKKPIEQTSLVVKDPTTGNSVLAVAKLERPLALKVSALDKELNLAVHSFGQSGLKVGEIIFRGQELLEPLGLFVAWVNSHPGFSVTSAYRMIAQYEASQQMARPIVEIAMSTGIQIVGTTEKKPYGRYTAAVEKVGPPPTKPTTEEAGLWLQQVVHTYNQLRKASRVAASAPTLSEAVKHAVSRVVALGNKLTDEEKPEYIYNVIDESISLLGVKLKEFAPSVRKSLVKRAA